MVGGGEGGAGAWSSGHGAGNAGGSGAYVGSGGTGAVIWDCEAETTAWLTTTGLSKLEYANTVRDLLGVEADIAAFPDDVTYDDPFRRGPQVSDPPQAHYLAAASALANLAIADLPALLPCDPQSEGEDECAQQLIDTLGPRALRRPLQAAENTSLFAAYAAAKGSGTFAQGIRAIVLSLLSSPSFIYRLEADITSANPGDTVPVPPYELATRLSYFLWRSMPDDELFASAASGALSTPEGLEEQAQRMLDDSRTLATMEAFHLDLLDLNRDGEYPTEADKDAAAYPEFSDELMSAMRAEIGRFAQRVIVDDEGTLEELLTTSTVGFVNDDLAAIYGVAPPGSGALVEVQLPPARSGLLTRAAFLTVNAHAASTSPTKRGLAVRQDVLCENIPTPPPDVDVTIPPPGPGLTTLRERLEAATSDPTCQTCHNYIDPVGFAFEGFDGIGRLRSTDNGAPVDDSGVFLPGGGPDQWPFDGAAGLAQILDGYSRTSDCVSRRWFEYALIVDDANSLGCVQEGFRNGGFEGRKLRNLVISVVLSSAFRYRPALSP